MIDFTGERFIPEIENEELTTEHMQRYSSILPIVKGKKVVDIACGEGYGTNILAQNALEIVGIDISEEAVENASKKYVRDNLNYMVGSVANIPLESNTVDVVVSYETIEHVDEESQKRFLAEAKRILKEDGVFIISTPNKELYSDRYNYHNEFHIKEFYKSEFIEFIRSEFKNIQLYNQYDEVVNIIENTDDTKEALLFKNKKREGKYYIVVASNSELPSINQVIKVRSKEEYARCITRILELQKAEEERNIHISKLDEEIAQKNRFIEQLQNNAIKDKEEYDKCIVRIVELQKAEEERNAHISKLDNEMKERDTLIIQLQEGEEKRNQHIAVLDGEIREKNEYIGILQNEVVEKNNTIEWQQGEIKALMDTMEKLKYETKFAEQLIANIEKNYDELRVLTEEYREQIQFFMNHAEDKNEKIEKIIEEREQHKAQAMILEHKLADLETKNLAAQQKLQECNVTILSQKEEVLRLNLLLQERQKILDELSASRQDVLEDNQRLNKEKQMLSRELEQVNEGMKTLQISLEELSATKQELQDSFDNLCTERELLQNSYEKVNVEKELLQNSYEEVNAKKELLQNSYEEVNVEKQTLQKRISEIEQELRNKQGHIELLLESDRALERLNAEKQALQEKVSKMEQELRNKQGHIDLLLESDRELERLKMQMDKRLVMRIFPRASKRRLFAKLAVRCVRHPFKTIKLIFTKGKVKNFFRFLKKDGVLFVSQLVDDNYRGVSVQKQQLLITQVKEGKDISEYQPITFVKQKRPKVSIVIPVYNQFDYTYNCLKSILKNSGTITYEIIIANDCSTDLTTRITEVVKNIKVITNPTNLRFLKNCNNAAKYAKGNYILFLNNDTQVQPNWLEPLVELIERDNTIGMVGSKLVYADGRLQEAGGILWKDGSAWNYGNKKSPEAPEFNYVKEADYISGAAIMIRTSLWKEIGGFDETFAPAYYEDTDLAFEVRKHGYKVMYQPLSVVVHFEGVSNGTDISSGQKAYQQINAQKFFEKWKEVLQKEHYPNGQEVFKAKDRSRNKKHILVIDHYVPMHDKDAGNKCSFMYISLFVKLGYKVTFIGDNYFKHEPYATELNQLGVEILYGNYYYLNWKEWLKENAYNFDYVYMQRPHISEKYIDLLKEYSKAKIIYFGHDLHYLREYRQYQLEKDPIMLKSSNEWKKKEFALFSKADIVYVVGSYEQQILQKEFPNKLIRNIPLYIYESLKENVNTKFQTRKDILFVGGFGHSPNRDAVLWFAQKVFPKVLKKYPDMKWYIVGSNPTEDILALKSDNIIVKGFVSDEELAQLYSECRMAVVPLRVGAGVKGKVVEAVYHRIPLLTTPIGAEGLSTEEHAFIVSECNAGMANIINNLYESYYDLEKLSNNCKAFIENHFTIEIAERIVREDFS